jgi:hypothetical protein
MLRAPKTLIKAGTTKMLDQNILMQVHSNDPHIIVKQSALLAIHTFNQLAGRVHPSGFRRERDAL